MPAALRPRYIRLTKLKNSAPPNFRDGQSQTSNAFFLSGRERPLSYTMLHRTFARIACAAGVKKRKQMDGEDPAYTRSGTDSLSDGCWRGTERAWMSVRGCHTCLSIWVTSIKKKPTGT